MDCRKASPPQTVAELAQRADALAGFTVGELAARYQWAPPEDLLRHKGWIGQLLEHCLGASSSSKAAPDFPQIGVEMKSLPINAEGKPQQSTYVCTAPMGVSANAHWETSWVKEKLSHVLWVPIVEHTEPAKRMIATPFLWRPDEQEQALLQADWKELTDLLRGGVLWQVKGKRGKCLQLRPKAASSRDRKWALSEEGEWVQANPKGFYLRAKFTMSILQKQF